MSRMHPATMVIGVLLAFGTPAAAQAHTRVDSAHAVQFQHPDDWTVEEVAKGEVLLLMSPVI